MMTLNEVLDAARASQEVQEALKAHGLTLEAVSVILRFSAPLINEREDILLRAGGLYADLVFDDLTGQVFIEAAQDLEVTEGG
jgi:hypothetical protein